MLRTQCFFHCWLKLRNSSILKTVLCDFRYLKVPEYFATLWPFCVTHFRQHAAVVHKSFFIITFVPLSVLLFWWNLGPETWCLFLGVYWYVWTVNSRVANFSTAAIWSAHKCWSIFSCAVSSGWLGQSNKTYRLIYFLSTGSNYKLRRTFMFQKNHK